MSQKIDTGGNRQHDSGDGEPIRQKHDSGIYAGQHDEQVAEHGVYEELTAETEVPELGLLRRALSRPRCTDTVD